MKIIYRVQIINVKIMDFYQIIAVLAIFNANSVIFSGEFLLKDLYFG